MTPRKRSRHIDKLIQNQIEVMAVEGWTPMQIHEHLTRESENDKIEGVLPSLRTVQRIVKDVTVIDSTGIWGLRDSEADDAGLVLEVLADVTVATSGRKHSFSKAEAALIVMIRRTAPDIPTLKAWRLANTYMQHDKKGLGTEALDSYLAFAPWRGGNRYLHYDNAAIKGWIVGEHPFQEYVMDWRDYNYKIKLVRLLMGSPLIITPDQYQQLHKLGDVTDEEAEQVLGDIFISIMQQINSTAREVHALESESPEKMRDETIDEILRRLTVKDATFERDIRSSLLIFWEKYLKSAKEVHDARSHQVKRQP